MKTVRAKKLDTFAQKLRKIQRVRKARLEYLFQLLRRVNKENIEDLMKRLDSVSKSARKWPEVVIVPIGISIKRAKKLSWHYSVACHISDVRKKSINLRTCVTSNWKPQ